MTEIDELKLILREKDIPFFSDDELNYYLNKHNGDISNTAYECLIIKSENTQLQVAGLNIQDSSTYFRRLADRYRPRYSRRLEK